MIKLTYLYYDPKIESLENFHNLVQHNEGIIFEWEKEVDTAKNINALYPKKPFVEPLEFKKDSDYDITEVPLRIRLEDILLYRENTSNLVEIITADEDVYVITQTMEELDTLFGI